MKIGQSWLRYWLRAEQALSHYLNQCWPSSLTYIYGTRWGWVKLGSINCKLSNTRLNTDVSICKKSQSYPIIYRYLGETITDSVSNIYQNTTCGKRWCKGLNLKWWCVNSYCVDEYDPKLLVNLGINQQNKQPRDILYNTLESHLISTWSIFCK